MTQLARLPASATPPDPDLPTWNVSDLTEKGAQAWLVHGGRVYTLRIARASNLILTK
jgi:hemin uptake protein HemP